MTTERKALVLSFVHSSLAIKNLEVAAHEARVSKDPEYKKFADDLKKLKDRMDLTFIKINKRMMRAGVNMEDIDDHITEIQDKTWDDPELNK